MSIFKNKKSKIGTIIYNHILNNKREYFIITILFFIGLITGVIFINNTSDIHIQEINEYLNQLFKNIQENKNIDLFNLLKKSVVSKCGIILLIWIGASTIIGTMITYGTIILKGFSIGYTISSIINSFGIGNGIIFSLVLLLLHNIIFIPAIFASCVSGLKQYKAIMKNKNKENLKSEIVRHTVFCILMLIAMIISSIIEVYVSTKIFIFLINYIKI